MEVMNLPRQNGFHPFFDKALRDNHSRVGAKSNDDAINSPEKNETETPDALDPKIVGATVERPGRPLKVQVQQSINSLQDDGRSDQSQNVHQATPPIKCRPHQLSDKNHDSKRRRLSPPEQDGSWFEQLQHEANANSEKSDKLALGIPHTSIEPDQDPDRVGLPSQPDAPESSPLANTAPVADLVSAPGSDKTVLRLNGKGGFGSISPKRKKKVLEIPKDDTTPPTKRARKKKSIVVILRYNTLLSERILQILGGQSKSIEGVPSALLPSQRTPSKNQNKRPTHPFFLGKAAVLNGPSISGEPSTAGNQLPAPLPSFTTPGKLRAHMLSKLKPYAQCDDSVDRIRYSRIFRLPGTVEAAWPPPGFQRVEPNAIMQHERRPYVRKSRKGKGATVIINARDHILRQATEVVDACRHAAPVENRQQIPGRLVLTGQEIQSRVAHELSSGLSPELSSTVHPGILRVWRHVPTATNPYDDGAGDSQSWVTKFAPHTAQDVLQEGKEVLVLKEWLAKHTVVHVGGKLAENVPPVVKSKRRNKQHELDDFIVGSDDDELEMLPATDDNLPNSLVRGQASSSKPANVVLISGPGGCGKTAAVYAVAKELGFEVFEINPGSRRSGKDIMDKVGNMTLNHQVRNAQNPTVTVGPTDIDNSLPAEPEAQQTVLNSFFTTSKVKPQKQSSKAVRVAEERLAKASRHKQSLILLEEVDILYDEDKQFWETVLELAINSKRPIIMTCTDEYVVPIKALSLYAILRFRSPDIAIAVDYMLLIAAAAGHLITRTSVEKLYLSRRCDLRASIMDLNFWCQMAVGAPNGGIEWFLPRWPPGIDMDATGQKFRVTSSQTFRPALNIFGDAHPSDEDILNGVWNDFHVDPSLAWQRTLSLPTEQQLNQHKVMVEFDKFLDILSSMDVFSRTDLPNAIPQQDVVDATEPPIPSKAQADVVEGYPLLQAHLKTDYEQMDSRLAINTHLGLNQLATFHRSRKADISVEEIAIQAILEREAPQRKKPRLSRADFSAAFDPISEAPSSHSNTNITLPGLIASSFDRPLSLITTDLAPYVRSIVHYDQELARQRQQLAELYSDDGRASRRLRKTRASRSALEGSQRASTRRDNWFEVKTLDANTVLHTGGRTWPKVLSPVSMGCSSRASSADPLTVD